MIFINLNSTKHYFIFTYYLSNGFSIFLLNTLRIVWKTINFPGGPRKVILTVPLIINLWSGDRHWAGGTGGTGQYHVRYYTLRDRGVDKLMYIVHVPEYSLYNIHVPEYSAIRQRSLNKSVKQRKSVMYIVQFCFIKYITLY